MAITTNTVGAPNFPKSTSTQGTLGKDDFLKLLVTQLRYQDPMNPMQGTEFAAQLAQFSSVEQLSNINTTLNQSLDANHLLTQSITNSLATTMIGKDVRATGDSVQYSGTGDRKLGYTLATAADAVTVKVFDSTGGLVRTMKMSGLNSGDNTFTWDGKDDNGASLAAGKYSFTVEASDAKGLTVKADLYTYGTVSAVRFKSDGTVFVVDGLEIPLANILEIMQG